MLLVLAVTSYGQSEEGVKTQGRRTSIVLTIDYGDGVQKRFPSIPGKKSFTVLDAMSWADKHPRGIDFVKRGRGERTLVTQIDDLKSRDGSEKSWIYRVNGKLGDRSCAVFPVRAGDTILWRFERYQ